MSLVIKNDGLPIFDRLNPSVQVSCPGLRFSFHHFKVYKLVFRFTCCKRTQIYLLVLVKAYNYTYV